MLHKCVNYIRSKSRFNLDRIDRTSKNRYRGICLIYDVFLSNLLIIRAIIFHNSALIREFDKKSFEKLTLPRFKLAFLA